MEFNQNQNLVFEPRFLDLDKNAGTLDEITEDIVDTSKVENIQNPVSTPEKVQSVIDSNNGDSVPNPTSDNTDSDNSDEPDESDDLNIDDLTSAEIMVELLNQEGLQIYTDIPKGLTMEQFVKDIPEYINSIEQEIRNDEAAKLGKFQEYYDLIFNQNIDADSLKPALMLENIASMDLDDTNLTTDDLIDVIVAKHKLRGLSNDEALALANLNAKDLVKLKEDALNSQKYVVDQIDSIKKDVILSKDNEMRIKEQAIRDEQNAFVQALNSINLTKNQRQEFFDTRYKRDQQIDYVDEQGVRRREFVTKFDILVHKAFSDPKKTVGLIDFLSGDSDIPKQQQSSYSLRLLEKLEGKRSVNKQKVTQNQDSINFKTRFF